MSSLIKKLSVCLASGFLFLTSAAPVSAQCPVCIVTVGGGMLLAKKLGIDDLLVAIWISALNTAISYWAAPKIKFKVINNPFIFSLLMFITTLVYFWTTGQLFVTGNVVLGLDKILLGLTLGLVAMIAGNYSYSLTKARNGGKTLFPYAKVAFPVGTVLILTLIFKFGFSL